MDGFNMKMPLSRSNGCLVDKYVGSDFDQVANVSMNIDAVKHVSDSIDDIKLTNNNLGMIQSVADNLTDIVNINDNVPIIKDMLEQTNELNKQAIDSADKAKVSEINAKASELLAGNSAQTAHVSEVVAVDAAKDSKTSALEADKAENAAKVYASNAADSETLAHKSQISATQEANLAIFSASTATAKATEARYSADAAKVSETNAKTSETNAKNSEIEAIHAKDDSVAASASANDASTAAQTSEIKAQASEASAAKLAKQCQDIYDGISGGTAYGGTWDPATGVYPTKPSTSSTWDVVTTDGVAVDFDGKTWNTGDILLFNKVSNKFYHKPLTTVVTSVNGQQGAVQITPQSIQAIDKRGDTVQGNIEFNQIGVVSVNDNQGNQIINPLDNKGIAIGQHKKNAVIKTLDGTVLVREANGSEATVYTTRKKPTTDELGVYPKSEVYTKTEVDDKDKSLNTRITNEVKILNNSINNVKAKVDALVYPYAMTKAEFDARREANKELFAGSGFVEWGNSSDKEYCNVNKGLIAYGSFGNVYRNKAGFGRGSSQSLSYGSRTEEPLVCVDGVSLYLRQNEGVYDINSILFPPAPNATKTYDSATGEVFDFATQVDPKYGNVAADTNEAVSRAFEGMVKNGDFRNGTDGWTAPSKLAAANGVLTATDLAHNTSISGDRIPTGSYEFTATLTASTDVNNIWLCLYNNTQGNVHKSFSVTTKNTTVTAQLTINEESTVYIQNRSGATLSELNVRNISIRPVTNQVITTRKDLAFLEVWHEDVSEKDIIVPFGNVQFGATSWEGIGLQDLTTFGVQQGYSAFGEWDETTQGKGINYSSLTEAQQQKFLQDPKNNCYFDPETKKLIQVRYRIRVVEGYNDSASVEERMKKLGYTEDKTDVTLWLHSDGRRAIGVCLVQRLNQGAYHPVWNGFGCAQWGSNTNEQYAFTWYSSDVNNNKPKTSLKDCFIGITKNVRFNGAIGSTGGRPTNDPYKFYDAIYAGQVEDLRLSAHKQDINKLLADSIRKAVSGEMRGKGKVPFTKAVTFEAASSSSGTKGAYPIPTTSFHGDLSFLPTDKKAVKCEMPILVDGVKYSIISVEYSGTNNEHIFIKTNSNRDVVGGEKISCGIGYSLTPEFDELPWTDIIGSPENIAATFPNGVVGQWIPIIPDGTQKEYSLNKKTSNTSVSYAQTINNGVSWSSGTVPFDSVKNSRTLSISDDYIVLYQYPTLSNFTEKADNSVVVGDVGDVTVTTDASIYLGNRMQVSLTGNIGKNNQGAARHGAYTLMSKGRIDKEVITASTPLPTHAPCGFGSPINNSPAVKALSTLTEKDGLLYLQLHGNELKFENKAPVTITGSALTQKIKGTVYRITDSAEKSGVFICVGNTNVNVDSDAFTLEGDTIYHTNGQAYFKQVSSSTRWGDDSTIPVISGEGTKQDLNGNTVKTFCHHTMIPLGISSYSDSSQSK